MPVLSPGRIPPPIPKPAAPPPPLPPPRQLTPKPPAPVPAAKPPQPPPSGAAAGAPPASVGEGTKVFTGLHAPTVEASIVEIKQDGSTGKTIRIVKETTIGRGTCDASYPADNLLSPRHASIANRTGKILLKDLGSQNGTFIKQRQDTELTPGDIFLLGRELFRFSTQGMEENAGSTEGTQVMRGVPKLHPGPVTAKLERIQLTGEVIEEFKLDKPETTLGRTRGDLIFKNDPYMSGEHARIVAQPGRFLLVDLKSRNGVYRKIRGEAELQHGDEFFAGEQIFRAEIKTT